MKGKVFYHQPVVDFKDEKSAYVGKGAKLQLCIGKNDLLDETQ